jgi:hypothetical protein
MSGRESSKLLEEFPDGLSSIGEATVPGLACDDGEYPLLSSGHVQLMSKRIQFAQRGRASLHYTDRVSLYFFSDHFKVEKKLQRVAKSSSSLTSTECFTIS